MRRGAVHNKSCKNAVTWRKCLFPAQVSIGQLGFSCSVQGSAGLGSKWRVRSPICSNCFCDIRTRCNLRSEWNHFMPLQSQAQNLLPIPPTPLYSSKSKLFWPQMSRNQSQYLWAGKYMLPMERCWCQEEQ